jgi:archaetidylinositol phosphate synthase
MVLNKYRGTAERLLSKIATVFSGLHPNTISAVSLLFALLAGIAFVFADKSAFEDFFKPGHYIYIMLAIASVCIFLNGFLDAVDGFVARMTNRTSKRGDLFDHALDRYADILIIGGIMLSPFCDTILGAFALIAVLMTSYMGTQAQALGCGRDYSGLLGRADRLVILIVVPLLQMWVNYYIPSGRLPLPGIFSLTILEYTMIWFFIAGNVTAIHRGIHAWRELRDQEEPQRRLDQYFELTHKTKTTGNPSRARASNPRGSMQNPNRTPPRHPLQYRPPTAKPKQKTAASPARKTRATKTTAEVEWDEPEVKPKPKAKARKKTKSTLKTKPTMKAKPRPKPQAPAPSPKSRAKRTKSTKKTKTQQRQKSKPKLKPKQSPKPKPTKLKTKTKPEHKMAKESAKLKTKQSAPIKKKSTKQTGAKTKSLPRKKTKLKTKPKGESTKARPTSGKVKMRLAPRKVKN